MVNMNLSAPSYELFGTMFIKTKHSDN